MSMLWRSPKAVRQLASGLAYVYLAPPFSFGFNPRDFRARARADVFRYFQIAICQRFHLAYMFRESFKYFKVATIVKQNIIIYLFTISSSLLS